MHVPLAVTALKPTTAVAPAPLLSGPVCVHICATKKVGRATNVAEEASAVDLLSVRALLAAPFWLRVGPPCFVVSLCVVPAVFCCDGSDQNPNNPNNPSGIIDDVADAVVAALLLFILSSSLF